MTETLQRNYRATFILDTREFDQPIETLAASIEAAMRSAGATITENRNLGRQEFIYVTDKRHTGDIYLQFDMHGPATLPAALQDQFRLDRPVKRVLVESI